MHNARLSTLIPTADLAWLLLLGSVLLITAEFLRPGSFLPGLLGGIGGLAALVRLSAFDFSAQGIILVIAALLTTSSAAWVRHWHVPASAAAALGTAAARCLLSGPDRIAWSFVALTPLIIMLLAWLLWLARRGWQNKRADV